MNKTELLESFDRPPTRSRADAVYEKGYSDGKGAAEREFAQRQATLSEGLVQAVKDLEFGFVEAQSQLVSSLTPLFEALCDKVLPTMIDHSYHAEVQAILETEALRALPDEVVLAVSPDQHPAFQDALPETESVISVVADPSLSTHAICIAKTKHSVVRDYDALSEEIASILRNFSQIEERAINDE